MVKDHPGTEHGDTVKSRERNTLKCLPVCRGINAPGAGVDIDCTTRCCLLFEHTGTATLIIEADGAISMVNTTALEHFGFTKDEVLSPGKSFLDYLDPAYREIAKISHDLLLNGEVRSLPPFECRIYDQAGRAREVVAQIGWIAESRQALISLMDHTDTKKAERERHRLNAIVEQSLDGILLTDVRGTIIYVNAAFEALSGYRRDEMVGRTVDHPFFSEQDRLILKQMRFSVSCKDAGMHRTPNERKDGTPVATATRIAPLCDTKGRVIHLVCTKKDIRRETELEAQLLKSQNMETLGAQAGGIAHDFNNIVAGILGFAEMTLQVATDPARIRRYAGNIIQACERARELVSRVLAASRQKEGEEKPVEIQTLVREALNLVDASIPATIKLRQSLRAGGCTVYADPTRIHQVVMNLCANASQAMAAEGGLLEVTLEKGQPPHRAQPPSTAAGSDYVRLVVRDSGWGIDPQILEHIFEPYFTTKAANGGTGLGLHLVKNIVEDMDGCILVDSTPGQGAALTVYLPCIDTALPAGADPGRALQGGKEYILVVDDETIILEVLHDMLAALGYRVETAPGALFALKRLKSNVDRYDLVITDLVMPEMNGRQLAAQIRQLTRRVPIILCTGVAQTITPEDDKTLNLKALLTKPIQYEELAATVRAVLDSQ